MHKLLVACKRQIEVLGFSYKAYQSVPERGVKEKRRKRRRPADNAGQAIQSDNKG
jgi:hypothetical protein